MANQEKTPSGSVGIRALPETWRVAVQLVGTFGLAVFLVLYYVLVIHPQQEARYEQLAKRVGSLIEVIEDGQSLVTRDQGDRLEALYVRSIVFEIALQIKEADEESGADLEELELRLAESMQNGTSYLRGLTRKDGGTISEMLTHKINNGRLAHVLAEDASRWHGKSMREIAGECEDLLMTRLVAAARAK